MKSPRTVLCVCLCLLLSLAIVGPSRAEPFPGAHSRSPLPIQEEPTALQKTGDLLIARPLLAVRWIIGVAAFPITWPVAAVLGDSDWAFEVCLREPTHQLFDRPLGRL